MATNQSVHMVVIDDDEVVLKLARRLLAKTDVELSTAVCGTEALALLRANKPDIILVDHRLTDCDGLDLVRSMRNTPNADSASIVLWSAAELPEHIVTSAGALGAVTACKSAMRSREAFLDLIDLADFESAVAMSQIARPGVAPTGSKY
ncbi:MAG: response regulator [Pseudomonadota bacterium]